MQKYKIFEYLILIIKTFLKRLFFDVESLAEGVAHEHESEHEQHDGDAWEDGEVGVVEDDVGVVFLYHGAPRRHWWLHSDSEEAQAGFKEYRRGEVCRRDDDDGVEDVRDDVPDDDSRVFEAEGATCLHESRLADGEDLSTCDACHLDPHGETDGDEDLYDAFAECERYGYDNQQCGQRPYHVDEPHGDIVYMPAEEAAESPYEKPDDHREEHGYEADAETDSGAEDEAAQEVAPELVGAEIIFPMDDRVFGQKRVVNDLFLECAGMLWVENVNGGRLLFYFQGVERNLTIR